MGRGWLRWLQWAAGALVVLFLVRSLAANWSQVRAREIDWAFRPGWVAASLVVILATYVVLVESWRRMLAGWGPRLPWWEAARIWVVSSMGKYIPGKVWAVAGMALLAQRQGVSPWAATGSAVLLQVVSIGTGALLVGLTGIRVLEASRPGSRLALVLILVASGLGLLAVLWRPLAARLVRLVAPEAGERVTPSPEAVLFGMAANLLAWVSYGAALWLLARGVLPGLPLRLDEAVGAFAGSYIAGLLMVLAPGGLGVRESVLVFMLQGRIGQEPALALAAVSRVGMTVADVLAVLPFARAFKETARHGA